MKKILALLILTAAPTLYAQEVWSENAGLGEVNAAECYRVNYNKRLCIDDGFPSTCTQAQMNAKVRPEGQAIPNLIANSAVGRSKIAYSIGKAALPDPKSLACKWNGWTQVKRDQYCTEMLEGQSAGCEPFIR